MCDVAVVGSHGLQSVGFGGALGNAWTVLLKESWDGYSDGG